MIYGYARVSTTIQDTDLQMDALRCAGAQIIVQEKRSGADRQRPELLTLLHRLQSGDVLLVYKLDRLARSLRHLMDVLDVLQRKGCGFRSVTEPIDTTTPIGVLLLQVLGAVGEFERSLIRERSIAGQVAAIKRGVRIGGRPKKLTADLRRSMKKAREDRGLSWAELGRLYGVSNTTARRYVLGDDRDRMRVLRHYL